MSGFNFMECIVNVVMTCGLCILNAIFFVIQKLFYSGKVTRSSNTQIVLITGCDTGFGAMASEKLTSLGYIVISACLTDEGCSRLRDTVALTVKCDVTNLTDVENLAKETDSFAQKIGKKLYGVINNAGIIAVGAVDWTPVQVYRNVMEVNFFGAVQVTKAMLPLMKRNPGSRFINVCSVAGLQSCGLASAYFASKHAVEGFTRSLRHELMPWNVHVANINPSCMRTPMTAGVAAMCRKAYENGDKDITSQYSTSFLDTFDTYLEYTLEDPNFVVGTMCELLEEKYPEMWNFPGFASRFVRNLSVASSPVVDFGFYYLRYFIARPTAEAVKAHQ